MDELTRFKSLISKCIQGMPIEVSEFTRPKGQEFDQGGKYEIFGKLLQQLSPDAPLDKNLEIVQSLKEDFAAMPDHLALLQELECHSLQLPAEFGGNLVNEIYPTLGDASNILGETEYAWGNYIMYGGLTAIAGDVGAGKTLLAMDLHRRQFRGLTWPDGTPVVNPGRKAVWLMSDQRLGQLIESSRLMFLPDDSIILAAEYQKPTCHLTFDNEAGLLRLNQIARDVKPWAIFIDTFTSAMGVKEQNKPEIINPVTTYLLEMAQHYQIAVILLCHTNSEGGIYGKALGRKCEHQLAIVLSNRHDAGSPRNLHCKRSRRYENTKSFGITYQNASFEYCNPHEEIEDSMRPKGRQRDSKAELDMTELVLILSKAGTNGISLSEATFALQTESRDKDAAQKAAQRAFESLQVRGKVFNLSRRWYLEGNLPDVSAT